MGPANQHHLQQWLLQGLQQVGGDMGQCIEREGDYVEKQYLTILVNICLIKKYMTRDHSIETNLIIHFGFLWINDTRATNCHKIKFLGLSKSFQ